MEALRDNRGKQKNHDEMSELEKLRAEVKILRTEKNIKLTIKYSNNGCTKQAANPQYIAKNILNREFTADMPNEKWLTDVTEFKYYVGPVVHKIYLSAILDLYDRRIVSFVVRDSNNNALVFDTFDEAIEKNPNAYPPCHSDRGYQYTNRSFHNKLEKQV